MSATSCCQFSAGDLCKIIKQCGESGVKTFELEGLKICFTLDKVDGINYVQYVEDATKMAHNTSDVNPFLKNDEINQKDRELEELQLTNPYEYESLLVQRELEAGE